MASNENGARRDAKVRQEQGDARVQVAPHVVGNNFPPCVNELQK